MYVPLFKDADWMWLSSVTASYLLAEQPEPSLQLGWAYWDGIMRSNWQA